MRARLSVLMFLQYAVPGAWVPLFSLILNELGFTPGEVAWACATSALGALLAPLPWGQIADRWVAAEHCISFCALLSGILLWVLAELSEPWPVFIASLGFWFFMIPVVSLGTALTFRHLHHPEREFGPVRLWGTVGWVAANWCLGCWFADVDLVQSCLHWLRPDCPRSELRDAFRLGGIMAICLSLYAMTLPHTPPSPRRPVAARAQRAKWLWSALEAPILASRLFRQRAFTVFCVCLMGLYITLPFSGQLTPLLLRSLGVAQAWIPATLTLAQSLEVATLALLPVILLRLEIKGTLFLGILAWTCALGTLAVGEPAWLVIASLGLHGVFITCFLVAGQVFVNRRAPEDVRASAQALLQFLNGTGLLAGHLLVGWIRSLHGDGFSSAFGMAAILAAVLLVLFMLGFRATAE